MHLSGTNGLARRFSSALQQSGSQAVDVDLGQIDGALVEIACSAPLSEPFRFRILIVDDEPFIRFAIAESLRDRGVEAIEAATADEAWDYLLSGAPVDAVFTDHRMPGSMTGAQLARRISDRFPGLPVLVTSGFYDGREWPGEILQKPYELEKTTQKLLRLMRRET